MGTARAEGSECGAGEGGGRDCGVATATIELSPLDDWESGAAEFEAERADTLRCQVRKTLAEDARSALADAVSAKSAERFARAMGRLDAGGVDPFGIPVARKTAEGFKDIVDSVLSASSPELLEALIAWSLRRFELDIRPMRRIHDALRERAEGDLGMDHEEVGLRRLFRFVILSDYDIAASWDLPCPILYRCSHAMFQSVLAEEKAKAEARRIGEGIQPRPASQRSAGRL